MMSIAQWFGALLLLGSIVLLTREDSLGQTDY